MTAVECRSLTKEYASGTLALDRVDLVVEPGQIFGLVGRNGAGKTTLMRSLIGLVRPTSGEVHVLGRPVRGTGSGRIGALIEAPSFHRHLSGRGNLLAFARSFGVPTDEVDRVLELVGLSGRSGDRATRYSLGMKQRLGIATALLGAPPLLILDEPVNGLDPQAIAETRDLLRGLRNEGHTILLSSHLLGEIDELCDRLVVLDSGRVVAEGTPGELKASARRGAPVELTVDDVEAATAALAAMGRVEQASPNKVLVHLGDGDPSQLVKALVTAGVGVTSVARRDSLEAAYLAMTSKEK